MAIRMVSVKCPECGANITIEENRRQAFCTYCGTQLILQNDNEHILRYIDEAELKHAQADEQIQMKKLEIIDNARKDDEAAYQERKKIGLVFVVLGVIAWFLFNGLKDSPSAFSRFFYYLSPSGFVLAIVGGFLCARPKDVSEKLDAKPEDPSMILIPRNNLSNRYNMSYKAVAQIFSNAGFSNIQCIPMNDLKSRFQKSKNHMISDITINGKLYLLSGEKAPFDCPVVITYHSY